MPRGHLRARVLTLLRRSHKKRRARTDRPARCLLGNITLIDQRPDEIGQRLIPDHWEGDLIKGKLNQSRVGTFWRNAILVERKTLFVALVKLEDDAPRPPPTASPTSSTASTPRCASP